MTTEPTHTPAQILGWADAYALSIGDPAERILRGGARPDGHGGVETLP